MKEVHLTFHVRGHYYDIHHPKPSRTIGSIVILQLPDMEPIRMVAMPGNTDTGDCKHCPVYAKNISGLPRHISLLCTECWRSSDGGYHYENIDKVLEGL